MNRTLQGLLSGGLVSVSLVLAACGGGGGSSADDTGGTGNTAQCDGNQSVHDIMEEWYYWYDQMPDVDPQDYASTQALLDVLTQPEQDLGKYYSYLTTVAEEQAFLSNAAYVGFGFSMGQDQDGRIFLKESFEGGPAHMEGMRRGDEIVSVNGVAVASMTVEQFNDALGPDEVGYEVTFGVVHADGTPDEMTVAKAEVEAPVVAHLRTDLGTEENITYIFFRSFVTPAYQELNAAFAQMKNANDTRLILDLRYNGGGLVDVAEHLGGLIAGVDLGGTSEDPNDGTVIAELDFNDKHQEENVQHVIDLLTDSVDVSDVAVITTGGTASASEMIINGLAPHMNVVTIGSTTYGKPVGQSGFRFCGTEILRAVTFKVVNSEDQGEYYRGITTAETGGCAAVDDIFHPLGNVEEASLASALHRLEEGGCDASASVKAQRQIAKRDALQPMGDPLIRDGWDVLTGGAR